VRKVDARKDDKDKGNNQQEPVVLVGLSTNDMPRRAANHEYIELLAAELAWCSRSRVCDNPFSGQAGYPAKAAAIMWV
jgi:hypothetical protein